MDFSIPIYTYIVQLDLDNLTSIFSLHILSRAFFAPLQDMAFAERRVLPPRIWSKLVRKIRSGFYRSPNISSYYFNFEQTGFVKDIDDYMNEKKTVQLNCKNIKR